MFDKGLASLVWSTSCSCVFLRVLSGERSLLLTINTVASWLRLFVFCFVFCSWLLTFNTDADNCLAESLHLYFLSRDGIITIFVIVYLMSKGLPC